MLHRLGYDVHILEQNPTSRPTSHMAGVCAGPDVLWFLKRFDRFSELPLGIPSVCFQSIDTEGRMTPFVKATPRLMTSWDALYFRLRANFDGLKSTFCPDPPSNNQGEEGPRALYDVGKQVISIEVVAEWIRVIYKDLNTGRELEVWTDFLLGADGPTSIVKSTFLGAGIAERRYAGYVAWRGVVPEHQVSKETRRVFQRNITYSFVKGGHIIVYVRRLLPCFESRTNQFARYNIPGHDGSLEEGKRLLNFVWYTNHEVSDLTELMTDVDGFEHRISIPAGKVRPELWAQQQKIARILFIPPYLEVIEKIASPFVHLVTDFCTPQASFVNGKVLLVGDASALLRPHVAFSTNQAAFQCMMVEKLVKGETTLKQWDWQITRFTYVHWCKSIAFGESYQRPWTSSMLPTLRSWVVSTLNNWRYRLGTMPEPRR